MEDPLKVSEIPKELTKIWDSLEGTSKMRASLFNLLVVTPKNQRLEYVRQITHKVIGRFPSRVIFVLIDKDSLEDRIDASVSVIPGENDVVCDSIEIDVTKKSEPKIPFVILPHLLPDLPVYLLWGEDPLQDNPLTHQLEGWATRIIFDSEVTENLPTFARVVLEYHRIKGLEIADLNWARVENWRELLSSTFYSLERLAALRNAQKITITYNSYATEFFYHTQIQALYLQSWLAIQLSWKLTSAKQGRYEYGSLTVELKQENNPNISPGIVISLDIITPTQTHFSFIRDPEKPQEIKTIICDVEKCEIPTKYIFTKSQIGFSLVNEVGHVGTSSHFCKVLDFISRLDSSCI